MNILILIIVSILFFFLPTLVRKWRNKAVLIAVAISTAVNTNYTICYSYPVHLGPFIFGVDTLVGLIFIYTIVVIAMEFKPANAYNITISSAAAIILAGIIESSAKSAAAGIINFETISSLLFNVTSAFSCLLGGFVATFMVERIKMKQRWFLLLLSVLTGSLIHLTIFFANIGILYPKIFDDLNTYASCIFGGLIETVVLLPLGLLNSLFAKNVLKLKADNN